MAPRDRLSGAGPKPLQAAAFKRRGRERWSQSSGSTSNRYASERRAKANPPMNRRDVEHVVKTRGVSSPWDQFARRLMTGRATTGVEGREADAGVAVEPQEPAVPMQREKHKRRRP